MKKVLLSIVVCLFAFIGANAQDKGGPIIEMKKEVHDYGTIENGADGTCEFKFKNTGQSDLVISNCRASCGCTVPTWSKDPIAPGKSGSITVKYDTKRTGSINKAITITSNAVNEPSKVVKITGTIKPAATEAVGSLNPVRDIAPSAAPPKPAVKPVVKATKAVDAAGDAVEAGAAAKAKKAKRWYQFWKKK